MEFPIKFDKLLSKDGSIAYIERFQKYFPFFSED